MDTVTRQITREVTLRLFKGRAGGRTPLTERALRASEPGFIELWSPQSRMAYRVRNRGRK
jgi:hypothetical protein